MRDHKQRCIGINLFTKVAVLFAASTLISSVSAARIPSSTSSTSVSSTSVISKNSSYPSTASSIFSTLKDDHDDDDDDDDDDHNDHKNERNHCIDRVWKEKDACTFIQSDACTGVGVGALFPYAQMYVCSPWRNFLVTGVSLMMLGVYLMNLFVAAGIVAADFFGPGLKTILTRCGLPSSTITAVLLAFGNGSIEVFSAISATRSGQTNLAYGELVSSAFCVTTLMVGMVAVFQPFRFVRRAFLRDTVFFLGVIVISIIILSDDDIKLFEGAGFLIMYIVYMLVVTVGTSWYGRDHDPLPDPSLTEDEDTPPILDDEGTGHFNVWEPIPASERNRPHIFSFIDRFLPPKEAARDGAVQEGLMNVSSIASSSSSPASASAVTRSYGTLTQDVSVQISRGQSKSLWSAYAITEAANFPAPSTVFQATTFEWLFPTLSQTWNRRSLYERILSVLIAPSVFAVRVLIPTVYDPDADVARIANVPDGVVPSTPTPKPSRPEVLFDGDESMEPSLYPSPERTPDIPIHPRILLPPTNLFLIQTFSAGFLTVQTFLDVTGLAGTSTLLSFFPALVAGVLTANAAKAAPSVDESMSWFVQGLSVLGGLGVLHFTAKEIIGVLGAFGVVLGWGSVLVGVTIFMLGCNLGDILTNVSLAHLGYTSLSVRTSFVSPMLNLLFGIGLSSVYVITLYGGTPVPKILDDDDDNEVAIFTSTSVLIIMYGLLASVAFSAVYVPYKGFKATRLYGWCLMGWWCFVMGSAVVLEVGWGNGMGPKV